MRRRRIITDCSSLVKSNTLMDRKVQPRCLSYLKHIVDILRRADQPFYSAGGCDAYLGRTCTSVCEYPKSHSRRELGGYLAARSHHTLPTTRHAALACTRRTPVAVLAYFESQCRTTKENRYSTVTFFTNSSADPHPFSATFGTESVTWACTCALTDRSSRY